MNFEFVPQAKLHDVEKDETVNQNFDKIFAELRRLTAVLQEYEIDLASDIMGTLPAENFSMVTTLGATDPGSATKFLNEQGDFVTISSNGGDASGIRTFFSTHVADSWRDMGCATSSLAGANALQVDTGGSFQRFTTAAPVNSLSGWRMTGGQAWGEHDPDLIYRIRLGTTISDTRNWVGMFASLPAGSVDTPTGRAFGFRYNPTAGDTGWRGFFCDSASSLTLTSTIVAAAVSTIYDMRAEVSSDGTLITFTINGVSNTLSPTLFTGALLTTLLQVSNTAGVARFVDFCRCHVETN